MLNTAEYIEKSVEPKGEGGNALKTMIRFFPRITFFYLFTSKGT